MTHLAAAVADRDHSQGPADAPVTLLVYGDYECPYTRKALLVVRQLGEQPGDPVRFVFRNFPLTEIHPHALHAAQAAEAAAAQGQDQFWAMHTYLFAHQQALQDADLRQYAVLLGLDTARFAQDMTGRPVMARINADIESGLRSGVQGTPTFFINGTRHDGSWELGPLLAAVARAGQH